MFIINKNKCQHSYPLFEDNLMQICIFNSSKLYNLIRGCQIFLIIFLLLLVGSSLNTLDSECLSFGRPVFYTDRCKTYMQKLK